MNSICARLGGFAASYDSADLSEEVVRAVERALLDTLAALVGGVPTANAAQIRQSARHAFGTGPFVPWFTNGEPLHFLAALMSNCAAASVLDVDDGHRGAAGHSSAAIVPAVLMEACQRPVSGHDILAAIAIGSDVALRIAESRVFSDDMSFASGRWTAYGVAAAIARLRGLSAGETAHAIAIAGAEAPQNLPQGACTTSSVKGSSPWSTVTAFVAVARAQAGAIGSLDILDRADAFHVDQILAGLGRRWLISELYFKPYASCRYTHPAIDGILEMREKFQFDPKEIAQIDVETFREASRIPNNTKPACFEDAAFSMPFTVALAALRGERALRPLAEADLQDSEIVSLAERVKLSYPAEFDDCFPNELPARVRIHFADHAPYETYVPIPKGDPRRRLDQEDLKRKIGDLSRGLLNEIQIHVLIDEITALKSQPTPAQLNIPAVGSGRPSRP
ncbi:MmgE/PrpD family protein [Bosea sp. (in: a-proteobacteria)]|uniref:MmgE/PrpD family protein n=1 Tax=Bosea sp. (in: a-proteobacteria) TaxID=1871050 RepID=UPI003F72FB06